MLCLVGERTAKALRRVNSRVCVFSRRLGLDGEVASMYMVDKDGGAWYGTFCDAKTLAASFSTNKFYLALPWGDWDLSEFTYTGMQFPMSKHEPTYDREVYASLHLLASEMADELYVLLGHSNDTFYEMPRTRWDKGMSLSSRFLSLHMPRFWVYKLQCTLNAGNEEKAKYMSHAFVKVDYVKLMVILQDLGVHPRNYKPFKYGKHVLRMLHLRKRYGPYIEFMCEMLNDFYMSYDNNFNIFKGFGAPDPGAFSHVDDEDSEEDEEDHN